MQTASWCQSYHGIWCRHRSPCMQTGDQGHGRRAHSHFGGNPWEVGALFAIVSSIRVSMVGRIRVTLTVTVRVSRVSTSQGLPTSVTLRMGIKLRPMPMKVQTQRLSHHGRLKQIYKLSTTKPPATKQTHNSPCSNATVTYTEIRCQASVSFILWDHSNKFAN